MLQRVYCEVWRDPNTMATTTTVRPSPETAAAQLVMQLSTGYIMSTAVQVATTLEIADKIGSGEQSAAELARASGVLEDPLYRVLRALASAGIFEETANRRFRNTPASDLLRKSNPHGLYWMARWISEPGHLRVYADIMYSMKTGKPAFDHTMGKPCFEYFPTDAPLNELFNNAMRSFSEMVVAAALKAYDFSGINVLVDVAGGLGGVLTAVLKQYPNMRGILMDLDHVIASAKPSIEAMGLADRCQTVAGDFFKAVPAGGDAYIMKHIIHDWDDERAVLILKNIAAVLKGTANGRVLLLDSVIPAGNEPDLGKVIDLEMLTYPGGRERTAAEFEALFARAGYQVRRIVPTEAPLSIVEATLA